MEKQKSTTSRSWIVVGVIIIVEAMIMGLLMYLVSRNLE